MAWWIWGGIIWAALASIATVYLAVVCMRRRRHPPQSSPSAPDDGFVPGFGADAPAATPLLAPSASEESVPPQRDPDSPPSPSGVRTQPLRHSPPAASAEDPARTPTSHEVVDRLVEGARTGGYTLPARLLDLHGASRLLADLELPAPAHVGREEAAAGLVSAAADGGPLDPMGLCAEIHRSRSDRLLYQEALDLLSVARERAQEATVREAAGACDDIIVEHLRPAYRDVLRRAGDVAERLRAYIDDRFQLDTPGIITASHRVRTAYLALPELVRQHSGILLARDLANALGERTPELDRRGLFSVFENPMAFSAAEEPSYDDVPLPPLPGDPTARLLWLVSRGAAPGRPWLPTVAEQDAAWQEHFGRTAQVPPLALSE